MSGDARPEPAPFDNWDKKNLREYREWLKRQARSRFRGVGSQTASDLAQSAMAQFVKQRGQIRNWLSPAAVRAYLGKVLFGCFNRRLRLKLAKKRRAKLESLDAIGPDGGREVRAPDSPPDMIAEVRELAALIARYIPKLPEIEQEIIRLRIWEGLTFKEIAERTGAAGEDIPRYRFDLAQEKLREWLRELHPDVFPPAARPDER